MDFDLSDHVSIVTGASKGLGKAMVEALVEEGASVFAVARDRDKLQELENQNPESVRIETFDFSDPNSLSRILKKAVEEFGRVNSIVNNAGIAPASDSLQTETSEFENVFKVNLLAPMVICQAAAQYFIDTETTGSIVNISSTAGLKGKSNLAAYSASKGGMLRLTESLSAEWARHGVRVNAIAPGAFETDAQKAVLENQKILDARLRKIPARRMGKPKEIGPLVCYLVSDLSSFVTGSTFVIDGGEVAKL
ncbi:MAG: SDR family oxidoreductase [Acidimicrobiales bacterium]|jgi:2-deoxy-D-gluconate 3-dehydrogenase|nr:SDR family oxidoreductase [Acidimicrobiales bacterium]MDP6299407.1 SDR family oxidoreductase [Acidimicrobiales bacterium]HJM28211.1 SDR family oxidoreductase [Acidimicrobiales bacterium]HJM98389.1 SDR family oxidoreductase [Acidimicrobiales bacterium]